MTKQLHRRKNVTSLHSLERAAKISGAVSELRVLLNTLDVGNPRAVTFDFVLNYISKRLEILSTSK